MFVRGCGWFSEGEPPYFRRNKNNVTGTHTFVSRSGKFPRHSRSHRLAWTEPHMSCLSGSESDRCDRSSSCCRSRQNWKGSPHCIWLLKERSRCLTFSVHMNVFHTSWCGFLLTACGFPPSVQLDTLSSTCVDVGGQDGTHALLAVLTGAGVMQANLWRDTCTLVRTPSQVYFWV